MRLAGGFYTAMLLSFLVAFMLTALPLPDWARYWRPAWVAIALVYWCLAMPYHVGVVTGWVVGLLLDVLHGAVLGQHALGLGLVAYITILYHQRIRLFPMVRQSLVVGSLVFFYLLLMVSIHGLLGTASYGYPYLLGACTSAALWPWVFVILRDLRRTASLA